MKQHDVTEVESFDEWVATFAWDDTWEDPGLLTDPVEVAPRGGHRHDTTGSRCRACLPKRGPLWGR